MRDETSLIVYTLMMQQLSPMMSPVRCKVNERLGIRSLPVHVLIASNSPTNNWKYILSVDFISVTLKSTSTVKIDPIANGKKK
ncbi:hypothetical protein MHBO_004607 [Bonamia ostreae]|uniref:Uncharacterized protein n=1 Tax=Bonamia ostreae TaxID=126728 RepID=A0ABV2ATU0_9EUKA